MAMHAAAGIPGVASISTELDPRWKAVVDRDRTADGAFYYSVRTTGVYCIPSCASRLALPRNVRFHRTREEAERAGFRACKRCKPDNRDARKIRAGESVPTRLEAIDWTRIHGDLDAHGWAMLDGLLSLGQCEEIAGLYDDPDAFRSQVSMARHGFGQGHYKYFAYPLPGIVATLRTAIYSHLAPIADRWNEAMRSDIRYPAGSEEFLARCHSAGQALPTPLLLRYEAGDYNYLHQDLYGQHVFPFQAAFLLSEPGRDFTGGEFVLTEQRPCMQSRVEVIPLRRGDGVIFAVNHRPVKGTRGSYRVHLRHGVSRLRSANRHALGVIFHDARDAAGRPA